jgi:hypothetical protein
VNRIPLGLEDVDSLRVTIVDVDQPEDEVRGGGGFREIRIPGVKVRQRLRPPIIAGRALAGRNLSRSRLTYIFERTTADDPFRRDRQIGTPQLELLSNREDPERQIQRVVFAPAARSYALDAWIYPAVDARDSQLDRLLRRRTAARFESSGRFENQPRYRASSAFDGREGTAWVGIWARPSSPYPWISWRARRPLTISKMRIAPARVLMRRPSVVRLSWSSGSTPPLRVGADGTVTLPRPVRARSFRLTILESRFPAGATARQRSTRAVGIGSLSVPGLPPVAQQAPEGHVRAACGMVRIDVGGREVPLRPRGTIAALEAGRPLRATGCGADVRMGEGIQEIRSLPGLFAVDLLRMSSPARLPLPPPTGGGEVVDSGNLGHSSVDDVRVALDGPSWLILGQSFSEGWEANCDGRSLGEPQPINGYANGWRAPPDCRDVSFTFGPQASARVGYAISAVVCALLLAFLIGGWVLRRGGVTVAARIQTLLPEDRPERMPLARSAAIAFVAALPIAFLFAARSFVVVFPLLTFILWRALGSRLLTAIAAGLLGVVVPIMYAIISPRDRGGYNFEYSRDLLWAHWVAVLAVILLMVVCWRALAAARPRGSPILRRVSPSAAAGRLPRRRRRVAGAGR